MENNLEEHIVLGVKIKKSRLKEQEAKGSLINLGIKTTLSKIPLLNILF